MTKPTVEQKNILDEEKSCVVVARPGSGKTFTMAHKIKLILEELPEYKGVIAISYTNKASDELKNRILNLGVKKKSSFFGTIDKFCLTEIVIPFLRHKFNFSPAEINITDSKSSQYLEQTDININEPMTWEIIENIYKSGEVILELAGRISVQLLKENQILREYLKARFSHIIVDEYQDSGAEQHLIFCALHDLGIVAIAVGDLDQSIYAFAGKSSEYLYELTQKDNFKKFALTKNHRCHPSISAYSLKFLNPDFVVDEVKEKRVYLKKVNGEVSSIVSWMEGAIPSLILKFSNLKLCEIGVLVRSNKSAKAVQENSSVYQFQMREETPLDTLSSPWAMLFNQFLYSLYDPSASLNDIFEQYIENSKEKRVLKKILTNIISIKNQIHGNEKYDIVDLVANMVDAAKILFPRSEKLDAENALKEVMNNSVFISSYSPLEENSIQIMTLHKSKGLEFRVVFHLDLYQWIIPSYSAIMGDQKEMLQSVNLHYVGITRAKEACILVSSSKRNDFNKNIVKAAESSEFLTRVDLLPLRKKL